MVRSLQYLTVADISPPMDEAKNRLLRLVLASGNVSLTPYHSLPPPPSLSLSASLPCPFSVYMSKYDKAGRTGRERREGREGREVTVARWKVNVLMFSGCSRGGEREKEREREKEVYEGL